MNFSVTAHHLRSKTSYAVPVNWWRHKSGHA